MVDEGKEGKSSIRNITILGVIPEYPAHSKFNVYSKIKMPPVGIISVFSQFNQDPRFKEVYIIDENNYGGPRDYIGNPDHNFLQKNKPAKIVMFYGGMSNSIPRLYALARQYSAKKILTIAGGSHVDALPADALRSGVNIVVHGEGEEIIQEILDIVVKDGNVVFNPEELMNVKGISFIDRTGNVVFTGVRESIKNLENLKDVDLTIVKYLEKRWSAIPISRGRGCNFNCEFCVVNKQYGKFKSISVEKAMKQVIKYSDMGYKNYFITDDNFAQNIDEAIEFCRQIGDFKRKFKRKISVMVQVRTEVALNDQLIEAMKYAGIDTLAIGYETPINEELRAMRKGVTVQKLVERSRKLSEHFYLHGMFIFGYPTFHDSTYRSSLTLAERAKAYKKFFKDAKIDTVQVLNAIPLPGSGLRKKLEAENRILPIEMVGWDKYDGLFLCYDPRDEGLDPYDLQSYARALMKSWYLGNFFDRSINFGNWMTWAYNATIGFPLQFGVFYTKRFFHNIVEKKRENSLIEEDGRRKIKMLDKKQNRHRNIFSVSLEKSWRDMQRRWRNLVIRTYGGGIVRNWTHEYKRSDYQKKLNKYFSKKRGLKVSD